MFATISSYTPVTHFTGVAAEHIDWVLHPNTNYVQSDGVTAIMTTDGIALFNGVLSNFITATASGYWTGMNGGGAWPWTPSVNTCISWSSNAGADNGTYGISTWTDDRAIAITSATAACNTANQLLCVEQ